MEFIYTDGSKRDVDVLRRANIDMAYGSSENTFSVEVPRDDLPSGLGFGSLVYAYDEEWGGRVTTIRSDTKNNTVTFGGRTWHGILESKVICPPNNMSYLQITDKPNMLIGAVLRYVGLDSVMDYEVSTIGSTIKYTFERYIDAYSGLRKALKSAGYKLKIKSRSPKPVLYAEKINDYTKLSVDSSQIDIDARINFLPVNHLICAGMGELKDRTVVHLYADRQGRVSEKQSIFGEDCIEEYYDYPNADRNELIKQGTERLREYQNPRSGDLILPESGIYDIEDIVGQTDEITGLSVASPVSKCILRLGDGLDITYELGISHSYSPSGYKFAESSGEKLSYVAGSGIEIDGHTIKSTVDKATNKRLGLVKPDGVTVFVNSEGELSTRSAGFLEAHPVGSIFISIHGNPSKTFGGAWEEVPSLGAHWYLRIK